MSPDLNYVVDGRSRLSGVRDQGERPTCVAFASTAGNELVRPNNVDLSIEYLHWGCNQRDPGSANGTTIESAVATLLEEGQCPDSIWPYNPDLETSRLSDYTPPSGAVAAASKYQSDSGERIPLDSCEITRHLTAGHGVVLGIQLYQGFFNPPATGIIPAPPITEKPHGLHAVLVCGLATVSETGSSYLLIRNSWGLDWGAEDYGFLAQDLLATYGLLACALSASP